jgi:hypothetical protein
MHNLLTESLFFAGRGDGENRHISLDCLRQATVLFYSAVLLYNRARMHQVFFSVRHLSFLKFSYFSCGGPVIVKPKDPVRFIEMLVDPFQEWVKAVFHPKLFSPMGLNHTLKHLTCIHHVGTLMHAIRGGYAMRTSLKIDDGLIERASKMTGIKEKTKLVKLGLEALIAKESAKRLAKLGGTEKGLKPIPRRRSS